MDRYQQIVNSVITCPTVQYPARRIHLIKLLGMGGQGGVFLGQYSHGDPNISQIAIKLQDGMGIKEQVFIENLIQYQNLYENPQSQFYYPSSIIRIYEMFPWNNKTAIIMEVGNGNLYEFLSQKQRLNSEEKLQICKQILKSIQMLHHFGYAHRDIKPENFLRVGEEWKLSDFGLTKSLKDQGLVTKHIGSPQYMAPELFKSDQANYTEKVDIWSLGCVFYEIMEGKELFSGTNKELVKNDILKSNDIHLVQINGKTTETTYIQQKIQQMQISELWKKTLLKMLQFNPDQRPSIADVIKEAFTVVEKNDNSMQTYTEKKKVFQEIPKSIKIERFYYQIGQNEQQNIQIPLQNQAQITNPESQNIEKKEFPINQQQLKFQPAQNFPQVQEEKQQLFQQQINDNQPQQNELPVKQIPEQVQPLNFQHQGQQNIQKTQAEFGQVNLQVNLKQSVPVKQTSNLQQSAENQIKQFVKQEVQPNQTSKPPIIQNHINKAQQQLMQPNQIQNNLEQKDVKGEQVPSPFGRQQGQQQFNVQGTQIQQDAQLKQLFDLISDLKAQVQDNTSRIMDLENKNKMDLPQPQIQIQKQAFRQNIEIEGDFDKKLDSQIEVAQQLNSQVNQSLKEQDIDKLKPEQKQKIKTLLEIVRIINLGLQSFCKEH